MSIPTVSGRIPNRLTAVFFAAVLIIAGISSTAAAVDPAGWFKLPLYVAIPVVFMLELSSVSLLSRADFRQRLGERAIAYRVIAAGMGSLAISVNWFGHVNTSVIAAAVGAGFSALGLAMAFLLSSDRRRDQLRAEGKLPPPAQTYSLADWLANPRLVIEARQLARETPGLGRASSLRAARLARAAADRRAAVAAVVYRDVAATKDKLAARLAVAALDFETIGDGIHGSVDNVAIADRYAAVLGAAMTGQGPAPAVVETAPEAARQAAPEVPAEAPVSPAVVPLIGEISAAQDTRFVPLPARARGIAARAVLAADPDIKPGEVAAGLGVAPRTLRKDMKAVTDEYPIVKAGGKAAAEKAPETRPAMGFQPPPNATA